MNAKNSAFWRHCRRIAALAALAIPALLSVTAAAAQSAGGTRFVNNTPFTVHIVAGSGRTDVCTLAPYGGATAATRLGQAEYFYPVFDVPLTSRFDLKDARPADKDFFYQIDDRRGGRDVIIDAVPPLGGASAYIVLVNQGRTGGVSIARTAFSRLSRIDGGGSDNVNSGESGVFRVNPAETGEMRIVSPVSLMFPETAFRPAYRYVYIFDGEAVELVDERPLNAIGLPVYVQPKFYLVNSAEAATESEYEELYGTLNEAFIAYNTPLRIHPELGAVEGGDVHFEVHVYLVAEQKGSQPLSWMRAVYTGDVAIAFVRNGKVLAEAATSITESNEANLLKALRRYVRGEEGFYRRIAGTFQF
jgi:hypothetical protein